MGNRACGRLSRGWSWIQLALQRRHRADHVDGSRIYRSARRRVQGLRHLHTAFGFRRPDHRQPFSGAHRPAHIRDGRTRGRPPHSSVGSVDLGPLSRHHPIRGEVDMGNFALHHALCMGAGARHANARNRRATTGHASCARLGVVRASVGRHCHDQPHPSASGANSGRVDSGRSPAAEKPAQGSGTGPAGCLTLNRGRVALGHPQLGSVSCLHPHARQLWS